jgi:hypothetical protein
VVVTPVVTPVLTPTLTPVVTPDPKAANRKACQANTKALIPYELTKQHEITTGKPLSSSGLPRCLLNSLKRAKRLGK